MPGDDGTTPRPLEGTNPQYLFFPVHGQGSRLLESLRPSTVYLVSWCNHLVTLGDVKLSVTPPRTYLYPSMVVRFVSNFCLHGNDMFRSRYFDNFGAALVDVILQHFAANPVIDRLKLGTFR